MTLTTVRRLADPANPLVDAATAAYASGGGQAAAEVIYGTPPGSFVTTGHGTTHFILEGDDATAPVVVLIHGLGANW